MAIYEGNNKKKLYLGNSEISKVYLGNDLKYQKQGSGGLPEGYTEIPQVKFVNNSWFNTEFYADFYTKLEINNITTGLEPANWAFYFGGTRFANQKTFGFIKVLGDNILACNNISNIKLQDFELSFSDFKKITQDKNNLYINNILVGTVSEKPFTADEVTYPLIIGFSSVPGYSFDYLDGTKIGEIKIYENNVLQKHWIPCIKEDHQMVGYYDIIEKRFLGSAGTQPFET